MVTSTRLSLSPTVYDAALNCIVAERSARLAQAENSEVLLFASVAVAVITDPITEALGTKKPKVALQEASVVAFVKPRKVLPWPLPD